MQKKMIASIWIPEHVITFCKAKGINERDIPCMYEDWLMEKAYGTDGAPDFEEWGSDEYILDTYQANYYDDVSTKIHPVDSDVSSSADRYTKKLDKDWDDDIYTIDEWESAVDDGWITSDDGSGYWVKDGLKSRDEVFSTPQLDATHIVWYNK